MAVPLGLLIARPVTAQDIDAFTTPQGTLSAPPTSTSSVAGAMMGGERDLRAQQIVGGGTVTVEVNGTHLVFVSPAGARGEARVTWDGLDGSDAIAPTGLLGQDLTAGGASALQLDVTSASAGVTVVVEVFTSGSLSSTRALLLPAVSASTSFVLPYSTFVPRLGTGANFSNVGAITLTLRGENVGLSLDSIQTVAVVAAVVTASKTDSPSVVSPGGTIDYTIDIRTQGSAAPATFMTLTDPLDSNTSLVAGSIEISPVAFDDVYYTAPLAPPLVVGAPMGVLANDRDYETPPDALTVSAFSATTSRGGSVAVAADGGFTYTPPPGFSGTDTFTYVVDDGNGITDTGIVSVSVTDEAPSVISTTPTNGATNQSTSLTISVAFSEQVNATTSSFTLNCGGGDLPYLLETLDAFTYNLTPSANLPAAATCTVTVVAAQVTDLDAVDPPDNMAANYVFFFTTDAPPSVTTTTPANGATQQAANTNVTINFTESVNATTNSFTINCGFGFLPYSLSSSPSSSFTLDPSADLPAGVTCTVNVFAPEVTDADTNDPPNVMVADYSFSFTVDMPPSVSSTTPTNGAVSQAAGTNLTVTFSEDVDVAGNWFQIVCPTSTRNVGDTVVTGGPTTFTINPNADLPAGETCTVTVFAAQITDQDAGDPPDTMTANYVFSFGVAPVANDDTYTATGNIAIQLAAPGVMGNDTVGAGATVSEVQGAGGNVGVATATTLGGSVTLNVNGSFTYDPPVGRVSVGDTFTYRISNASGTSAAATVTVNISSTILWFVCQGCGGGNTGTLLNPFTSIGSFSANNTGAADKPKDNQFVYIRTGTYSLATDNLTLRPGQQVYGQGMAASAVIAADANSHPSFAALIAGIRPTIQPSAGNGVNLSAGNNRLEHVNVGAAAGIKIASGASFGTFTVQNVILSGAGQALGLTLGTLSATFDSVSSSGVTNGIFLTTIAGSLTINGGSLTALSGADVRMNGGTANVTYAGTITNTTGRSVDIINRTGGTVSFTGAIVDTGTGIFLDNNDNSTIRFSGGLSVSTGASAAFTATNGGIVEVCDENPCAPAFTGGLVNTLTTTTGTALNVSNTTIGANRLEFRSISANGATNGIVLNVTGSGTLAVKGNGGTCTSAVTCTGGAIRASTSAGLLLTSTGPVSLANVDIEGGGDDGIRGSSVGGFTLTDSRVVNNGNAVTERGLDMTNLTGAGAISGSTLSGNAEDNLYIVNTAGTLSSFNVTASTFSSTSTAFGNDGIHFEGQGSANMTISVTGSTFSANRGDHFQATTDAVASGNINVTFTGNTLTGDRGTTYGGTDLGACVTINTGGAAQVLFDVSNNTITGSVSSAISINSSNTSLLHGTLDNNVIGLAGTLDSGSSQGDGLSIFANGSSAIRALITNNTIRQYSNLAGINLQQRSGSASLQGVVRGNTISNGGTFAAEAIFATAGTTSGDSGTMCLQLGGAGAFANAFTGVGANGSTDFRVRQRFSTTVRLPGYGGGNTDVAAVVAFIQSQNGGTPTGLATTQAPGGGFVGGGACTAP